MDDQFTEWHSVRPWHPTLSLSVREITSVSVTFILSSPYSANDPANQDLASLALTSSDDDDQSRDSASTTDTTQSQVVSDILAKGLSVKVNGTPWQRVFLKMDDVLDEAIIILYGLMPARQYDVELGILPGEASVRGQITTDTEVRADTAHHDNVPDEAIASSPESSTIPLASSSSQNSGGTHTPNGLPSPNTFTLEDRRVQLNHTLSLLAAEHSSLTTTLKSARRESQKADAALRSEIDTLKRASERQAAGENRARKKVLALQEAVKQTLAAARDIEAMVADIEAALPALEQRKAAVEKEWAKVKGQAEKTRARRLEAEQREKARVEAMQTELGGLANRLDRLNGKREKLEGGGGVIADLEERLRKLQEERERVENDPYGYEGDAATAVDDDEGSKASEDRIKDDSSPEGDHKPLHASSNHVPHNNHPHPNFHPPQHVHPRKRHSHPHMPHQHHHPRPSFPPARVHQEPVHRPAASRASFPLGAGANHSVPVPVPGVIHLQPQHHPHPHKNAHHHNHGHHHNNHNGPHTHPRGPFRQQQQQTSSSSSSVSATPIGSTASAAASGNTTLSSRAPPFEPGRGGGRSRAPSQSHTQQATVAAKSELNPGSTPFAPRSTVPVVSVIGSGAPGRTGS